MRATFTTGALAASLAAGPIVLLQILLLSTGGWPMDARTFAGLPIILILATLIGFVVAFVPSFVATAALVAAGRRHAGGRHPLVWAATGLAAGWLLTAAAAGFDPGVESTVVGIGGLVCALISRSFARWEG